MALCPACATPRPGTYLKSNYRGHHYECVVCGTRLLVRSGVTMIFKQRAGATA